MLYMIFSLVNFCINIGFVLYFWNILFWFVCCEINFFLFCLLFLYLLSDLEIIIDYVCVDVDFFYVLLFLLILFVCILSKYFECFWLWLVLVLGYIEMFGFCFFLFFYIVFLRNWEFGLFVEVVYLIFLVCKFCFVLIEWWIFWCDCFGMGVGNSEF